MNRYTHSCAGMRTHRELQTMTTTERMNIQLSETTERLLKRIVGSRLGSGSGSGLRLMCDCMVEHLSHEEARRLGVTDQDLEGKE